MALSGLLGVERNPTFNYCEKEDLLSNHDLDYSSTCLPIPPNDKFNLSELHDADDGSKKIRIHFDKGTTTLAFKYQGGVVVCADSRATGGQFIGSQSVRKIIPINEYLLGTMAGGAADCTYWERILAERCRIYELRNRERISVAAASKLLANILYNYKG